MQEVNALVWPVLYGYTGWLWGGLIGALCGALAGLLVGVLTMRVNPFGPELFALPLALGLPWLLGAETWRWTALVLSAVPLPRLAVGLALKKTWT